MTEEAKKIYPNSSVYATKLLYIKQSHEIEKHNYYLSGRLEAALESDVPHVADGTFVVQEWSELSCDWIDTTEIHSKNEKLIEKLKDELIEDYLQRDAEKRWRE